MKKLDLVQMEEVQGGRKFFGNETIVGECQSTVGTIFLELEFNQVQ